MAANVAFGNRSTKQFVGWVLRATDYVPAAESGADAGGDAKYVLGRQKGSTRSLSLYITTTPGSRDTLDLDALTSTGPTPAEPTPTQKAEIGTPAIAGTSMTLVSEEMDGMFWCVHWRARLGPMLIVHLWSWWCPAQGWAEADLVVVASNPSVADMYGDVPADFVLTWAGTTYTATVVVPGITPGQPILAAGERIWDGQARSFPVTFKWSGLLSAGVTQDSADAAAALGPSALTLNETWAGLGNPRQYTGWDVAAWVDLHMSNELGRLHDWSSSPLGIIQNGRNTGGEGDQMFHGAAFALGEDGIGADQLYRLVAMVASRRPCNHHEADGSLLDLDGHPLLQMYDGRAHFFYSDHLGKPRELAIGSEAHGWWGPWSEHYLINGLALAHRAWGSPGLHWQLEVHARITTFQHHADPAWSSAGFFASRAAGYEGYLGYHLHHGLWDDDVRDRLDQLRTDRVLLLMSQVVENGVTAGGVNLYNGIGVWQIMDAASLSTFTHVPLNWMPYQQSVGAAGVYLISDLLSIPGGKAFAARAAQAVLDRAFDIRPSNGHLRGWDFVGFEGDTVVPLVEGGGAHLDEPAGVYIWHIVGAVALLEEEPNNATARLVVSQYLEDHFDGYLGCQWFPPQTWDVLAAAGSGVLGSVSGLLPIGSGAITGTTGTANSGTVSGALSIGTGAVTGSIVSPIAGSVPAAELALAGSSSGTVVDPITGGIATSPLAIGTGAIGGSTAGTLSALTHFTCTRRSETQLRGTFTSVVAARGTFSTTTAYGGRLL